MYLIVSASEVGCQFSTQQLGIASCYYYMQVGTEKAVYEQMPSFYILYFIKKDVVDVCAVILSSTIFPCFYFDISSFENYAE